MHGITPCLVESEACLLEFSSATSLNRIVVPVHIVETDLRAMPSSLESHQIVTYTQGEQLGLLHRLRVRADDGAATMCCHCSPASGPGTI